ncbi:MAG: histidinol-phosphate transaminase [Rhodanobacteraceae bacterium]|nr:histidinol-phosphate transaminase [Rhodanobacteraceae bacterium]
MSVLELARPELLVLKPYSSARMEAGKAAVMLNANESPYAPFAGDALALNRYPDPQPAALLDQLGRAYGVDAGQIFVGRGSDEAIDLLVRAFCRAGRDAVLICPPTFGMYAVAAGVQGAAVVAVPLQAERDFALDVDGVLNAARVNPVKLVFVCTPNNPTGGSVPIDQITGLATALAGRALVVVDEAYAEFADTPSVTSLLDQHPNLVVLRTLSKAYGLAGARLGVLIAAPEIIGLIRRIMAPYPLPTPCLAAALAAFSDAASAARVEHLATTRSERRRLATALRAHPAVRHVWPSDANFVAFRVDDAHATWRQLLDRGVIVRDVSHYLGLANCLRVSAAPGKGLGGVGGGGPGAAQGHSSARRRPRPPMRSLQP